MTKLQQAAYDAQLAAALPTSLLAVDLLSSVHDTVDVRNCATYINTLQMSGWFQTAFSGHTHPVTVVGGGGLSRADAQRNWICIGVQDRTSVSRAEHACLHELAHIVTCDREPDGALREAALGRGSSKGHHHAWRANFVIIVRKTLGEAAAARLRREFDQWGLPTRR